MNGMDRRMFLGKSVVGTAGLAAGVNSIGAALGSEEPNRAVEKERPVQSAQRQVEYGEAVKTKYPEQVIVAIAKDKDGKANPVTMGWTMITSGTPPMMAVSMHQGHYTVTCVRHSKCFTIAYPASDMVDAVMFFGTHSGWNTDKFAEFKCANEPARKIDSVLLTGAVANFECQLEGEYTTGDHIVFVGRIVVSHVNTAAKKRLYILGPGRKLGAVCEGM